MLEFLMAQVIGQSEFFLRLIVACVLGGAIGFERKNRNKGAGMRTHALVCLGAALIMVVSKYGFGDIPDYDASRVAAQVVSGIGFLGAGIIFVRNNSISGLTTAAGIWVTSGVGLSIGSGQYFLATVSTLLVIGVQVVLHRFTFLAKEPYRTGLKVIVAGPPVSAPKIEALLKTEKIEIVTLKINKKKKEETEMDMEVIYPAGFNKVLFINALSLEADVITVRG